jgi:hypothetical protein
MINEQGYYRLKKFIKSLEINVSNTEMEHMFYLHHRIILVKFLDTNEEYVVTGNDFKVDEFKFFAACYNVYYRNLKDYKFNKYCSQHIGEVK